MRQCSAARALVWAQEFVKQSDLELWKVPPMNTVDDLIVIQNVIDFVTANMANLVRLAAEHDGDVLQVVDITERLSPKNFKVGDQKHLHQLIEYVCKAFYKPNFK